MGNDSKHVGAKKPKELLFVFLIIVTVSVVCITNLMAAENATNTIKVACVGDSITEGYGIAVYPSFLGKLMGSKYQVNNYGVGGCTLLKKGDKPYWNQSAYTNSHAWQPDIVLIMLGTNDSKPYNWSLKEEFKTDYAELIKSYRNLSSHPKIYVMTSPTVFNNGNWGITNKVVTGEVVPKIKEVAVQGNCPLVDVNSATKAMGAYFTDNIHPNETGASKIADYIYSVIKEG
jgi:lysophospholipase L1-like esterase